MNLFSGAEIYQLVFVTLPREGPYTYREGILIKNIRAFCREHRPVLSAIEGYP